MLWTGTMFRPYMLIVMKHLQYERIVQLKQQQRLKEIFTISVSINSNIAYVNGEQKMLDVPAEITNGRTFVPVRFFGEALGMNVDWDGYTKTVIIESK